MEDSIGDGIRASASLLQSSIENNKNLYFWSGVYQSESRDCQNVLSYK